MIISEVQALLPAANFSIHTLADIAPEAMMNETILKELRSRVFMDADVFIDLAPIHRKGEAVGVLK